MAVYRTPGQIDPFSNPTAYDLADARGWLCECGCGEHVNNYGGPERNHAIVPDRKRYHTQVSCAWNYQLVAKDHHEGEHTLPNRLKFYRVQCNRYGKTTIDGALEQLPIHPTEIRPFLLDSTEG